MSSNAMHYSKHLEWFNCPMDANAFQVHIRYAPFDSDIYGRLKSVHQTDSSSSYQSINEKHAEGRNFYVKHGQTVQRSGVII